MPTIDELAQAIAASDTDELLVSQSGVTCKVTRAQVLAGIQPALAIPAGTLLGRTSVGIGAPETITVGANLSLSGNTISANAAPLTIAQLPLGTVPAPGDVVPIGQSGNNTAVTYGQFLSGLHGVANLDATQTIVTPTGTATSIKMGDLAASIVPITGGAMTGPLVLNGAPTAASQAATKAYVDGLAATALPRTGGSLTGVLSLTADPAAPLQAATKGYVDAQSAAALPKTGGTLTGALTLTADPVTTLQASTKQYVDTRLFRNGDTLTGPLLLAADPVAPLQAATKEYVDAQTTTALPRSGGTLTGPLTLSSDPTTSLQASTKQYVDSHVVRNGDTMTGTLVLAADPVAPLHAATKEYVDAQAAISLPKAGGTLIGPLTLSGDPINALQASTKQYVDAHVVRAGDTLTGVLTLAGDPVGPLQAATKGYVDNQVSNTLPKTGGTLSGSLTLSGDPAAAAQAATKRYVDGQFSASLPLAGGTLNGPLTLSGNPATASQAATKQYVDGQFSTVLPLSGGTLTGPLLLAAAPTSPSGAATKQYVDTAATGTGLINVKAPPFNAQLNGTTDDTAAFAAAYAAAPAGSVIYVPFGVTVLQGTASWGVPLTKRVKWIVDGTTLSNGTPLACSVPNGTSPATVVLPGVVVGNSTMSTEFSQGTSQSSDFAVLHSSYVVDHNGGTSGSVITNSRNDTFIYNSPNNYVWGGLDRLVWVGVQTPSASAPAQHVARYMQTVRQSIATGSAGQAIPQPQLWTSCLEYRDTTGLSSSWSNSSLVVEMDWIGNGADDGSNRQIQSLVVSQNDPNGAAVEVSTVIGVYLGGGSTGHADKVFNVGIPFSTAVLDTTWSQQMSGAAAIRLAAGHAIAFEPSNTNYLAFDSRTATLRWNQGTQSYVVGKGITVGWQTVVSSNTTLPGYLAGNIIFLQGSGSYTVILPAANSIAAGVGFTFTNVGSANVSITPAGTDGIECGPITVRPNDRYHVVSDNSGSWHEIFRANFTNPHFLGMPVLQSYLVSNLPAGAGVGAMAFATNGRKPADAAGAGTGVQVFNDGTHWISVCSGTSVVA